MQGSNYHSTIEHAMTLMNVKFTKLINFVLDYAITFPVHIAAHVQKDIVLELTLDLVKVLY